MVFEVQRENGDKEHTYAHLAQRSTSVGSEELITVTEKRVSKRDDSTGAKTTTQKVRRKLQLEHTTPERRWTFDASNGSPIASGSRHYATLPSSTNQADSATAPQKTKSRKRRTEPIPPSLMPTPVESSSYQQDGSQTTDAMTDD